MKQFGRPSANQRILNFEKENKNKKLQKQEMIPEPEPQPEDEHEHKQGQELELEMEMEAERETETERETEMETKMEKKNMINSLPMLNLGLEIDFNNDNGLFDSEHDEKEKKKEIEKGEERREKKNFIYSGIFEKNLSQNFMRISREYETLIDVDDLFDNRIFFKNKDQYNPNKITTRKKDKKRKEKEKLKKGKKSRKSNIKIENFENKMTNLKKRKSKVKDKDYLETPKTNNKLQKNEFYNVLKTLPEQIPPELINYFQNFSKITVLKKLFELLNNSLPIPFNDNVLIDHNNNIPSTNTINLNNTSTVTTNIDVDSTNTTTNNNSELIFKNDQKAINNSFKINYSKLNEYEQLVLKLFWYALGQIISKEKNQETKENQSPNVSGSQNGIMINAERQDKGNERKKSKFSIPAIFYPFLENEEFYQTLICCCFEIVIYLYKNKKLQFPTILKLFNLSCFEFSKILPVAIPSFQILPNLLINHLIEIQTDIISKHIWERDSKFLQIFKKIPDENKIELIRNLTADSPQISDGFANILYSHLNLAKERIQLLLQKLNYGNDNVIFYQIWNTYLYLLLQKYDLIQNSQLDIPLICCVFIILKIMNKTLNNSLDQIISHYREMNWKLVNFSFINNNNNSKSNSYDNNNSNDLGGGGDFKDDDDDDDDDDKKIGGGDQNFFDINHFFNNIFYPSMSNHVFYLCNDDTINLLKEKNHDNRTHSNVRSNSKSDSINFNLSSKSKFYYKRRRKNNALSKTTRAALFQEDEDNDEDNEFQNALNFTSDGDGDDDNDGLGFDLGNSPIDGYDNFFK